MARNKKSSKTQNPRTARRRRPNRAMDAVAAQPFSAALASSNPDQLVKVNSAIVRRRQNARAVPAGHRQYRSAAEFVREQPTDMPTRQVIEAGARLGLKMTAGLVRVTRFKMRHRGVTTGENGAVRRGRPPKNASTHRGQPSPMLRTNGASTETQFRRLVIEVGTVRAHAVVSEVEQQLEALLGGV